MEEKAYWVGFNLVRGVGAVRVRNLLDHFGKLEIAWDAPAGALISAGLPARVVENFLVVRKQVNLDVVMKRVADSGVQVITWDDDAYPRRLKEIDQPPPLLFVRGSINVEDDWAVSVVGTRRVTPYGRQVASEIARYLAQNGVTVVSGLARGVDAIAHQTAMQAGGRTLAILGSGVDTIYPPEHRKLAEDISKQGAVISDYPLGTQPESRNFPPRNRIIAGLSLATIVVEAGETSGALITAEFAVNQGRDVFAVPGSILTPQSEGTNRLIEQGARPLLRMSEILESLKLEQIPLKQASRKAIAASPEENRLLSCLTQDPRHIDEICAISGLPIQAVSATLTMMELKGLVTQVGGMNYVAARETKSIYKVG
ncbi:MAG: DNA-processing protein DprA [Anaerolineaceae bacterium]|nr:DNA-processing protein DprA [Anaerolineaceae bacterium]